MPFQKIPCPNCGYERFMTVFVTNHVIETKTCPKCQKRMTDEHLANVDELQSYLIHRIEKFLNNHGRHLLGWDEILQWTRRK